MVRSPNPEPPVLALLALLFAFYLPDLDLDGDGFKAREERDHGCNPLDDESFPVCADLDGDGLGEWPLIAPRCDLADGLAPCA